LAIAVAGRVGGRFTDGVWFVDLAPLTDPGLVADAVADGFGRPAGTAGSLARHLRRRNCLLVLDNCEHVVHSCAELVSTLLRGCPGLGVLATSREALGVLGEVAWPVPPLAVPRSAGLADVSGYDAVRLFLDRAGVAAVRGFTADDRLGIADLCARLDGLPLAIELAAARTAVLGIAEITERLHDPALLCITRHPDRPHHRAMHATIAWSYDLLDSAAQDRFRRLAVFAGGFRLGAAEAVWGASGGIDWLTDLVAKSLVVVERDCLGTIYRMLETIGRWASARLAESPEAERDARARHAAHYLALAEEADGLLDGPQASTWLARLTAEHENLRAALSWFAGCDPIRQLRLAVALAQYCRLRGRYAEGRQWLERALASRAIAAPGLVGRALSAIAGFAQLTCEYDEAQRFGEQAMDVWGQAGDQSGMARTLRMLAGIARERGEYPKALTLLDRARAAQGAGDTTLLLSQKGFTWWLAGGLDRAERAMTAALNECDRLGDRVTAACIRVHLGVVAAYRGQLDLAERLAGEGLAQCRELDTKEGIAWAWNLIGLIALRRGRYAEATIALRASLEVHHSIGDRWRTASVLDTLAEAVLASGAPARAAEFSGLATAIRETLGVPVPTQERPAREHTLTALRRSLSDAERHAAHVRGTKFQLSEVIASLDALETRNEDQKDRRRPGVT
jgi:predicted ATPase